MPKETLAIAMSGGLDSSVAAALLLEQGYEVFGLTARTWPPGSSRGSNEDILSARRVAAQLGIAHHVADLTAPFERDVVRYFADEYAAGRTPSPCSLCNRTIKFGALLDTALRLGASRLATGHYCRLLEGADDTRLLLRGVDRKKDQSYFLFALTQRQLQHAVFPLGELHKTTVRELAAARNLPVVQRPESQDLCFVASGEHWRITERYRPDARRPGRLVDLAGACLGRHDGIHHFTIGQRRGLGFAGGKRLYVAALRQETNEVVLAERSDLMAGGLLLRRLNWLDGRPREDPLRAHTRIRYNQEPAPSRVLPRADGCGEVLFDEPQFAVTPGQVAAFYVGDELMGGGWIETAIPRADAQRDT